jgi:hypothetical protein
MIMPLKGGVFADNYVIGIVTGKQFLIEHGAPPFCFHYSKGKTRIEEGCEFLRSFFGKMLFTVIF